MPVPGAFTDISETPSANSPGGSENVGTQANDYLQAAFAFIRQIYDGTIVPLNDVSWNSKKITNLAPGVAGTDAANCTQVATVLGAPSGTRLVAQQATAPAGWTIDTSSALADCSVRFNNVSPGSGGTVAWSTWNFGGVFTVNGHAITTTEMPSHTHTDGGHAHGVGDSGHAHGVNDPGHAHTLPYNGGPYQPGAAAYAGNLNVATTTSTSNAFTSISIAAATSNISIGTGYASIQYNGGNAAHTHTYTTPTMKYADVLTIIKS